MNNQCEVFLNGDGGQNPLSSLFLAFYCSVSLLSSRANCDRTLFFFPLSLSPSSNFSNMSSLKDALDPAWENHPPNRLNKMRCVYGVWQQAPTTKRQTDLSDQDSVSWGGYPLRSNVTVSLPFMATRPINASNPKHLQMLKTGRCGSLKV